MPNESLRTFEDLDCWKACRGLRRFVAKEICGALPKEERLRLSDQILRSARSTTANIAGGCGRFHYLDNANFCSNARTSCWEYVDDLITAHDKGSSLRNSCIKAELSLQNPSPSSTATFLTSDEYQGKRIHPITSNP